MDNEKNGDELKAYNLDTYDEESAEDEEKEGAGISRRKFSLTPPDFGIFSNVKGLSYYANNDEDPYITLKEVTAQLAWSN